MDLFTASAWAFVGAGFTFLATVLGSAMVFFFHKDVKESYQQIFLGFAAGVMIAASVWSLLIPAIEEAQKQGFLGWIPAAGGFAIGGLFLFALDKVLPHLHPGAQAAEGVHTKLKRSTMLIFAVTLHNIPEGMAVGLTFAIAAGHGFDQSTMTAAITLAIGMAIQNFPEGAAISLPLRQEGLKTSKAFVYGGLSGIVEPIFGVVAVLIAGTTTVLLPWLLSFAAGAMIYVVVEELIPQAHLGEHTHRGTAGVMVGFLIMMVLDIALG